MNALLAARSAAQSGIFTTADATLCGYDARALRSLVRSRACVRIARGLYAARRDGLPPEERHRQLTRAMLIRYDGRAVASHHSALVLHRLAVHGVDLGQAQLMSRQISNSRKTRGMSLHLPLASGTDTPTSGADTSGFASADGWPTVWPAVAVVQNAMLNGAYNGVVSADAALHRELVTTQELAQAAGRVARHPGARAVGRMLRFADGRAESVGESRLRLELLLLGLPVTPQYTVEDGGQVIARADFRVTGTRLLVEFDGLVKYRGDQGERAIVAEKQREDRLRRLGWLFERVVWKELDSPAWIGARIRATLRSARQDLASRERLPGRPTGIG